MCAGTLEVLVNTEQELADEVTVARLAYSGILHSRMQLKQVISGHNIFHQIMLKYSCEGASSSVWACAQSSPPQFSRLCHESILSWVDKGWRFTSIWWRFQPFVIGHRKVRPKNEIKLFLKLLPCVLLIMFQEKKDIKEIWKEVCFRLFTNMVL